MFSAGAASIHSIRHAPQGSNQSASSGDGGASLSSQGGIRQDGMGGGGAFMLGGRGHISCSPQTSPGSSPELFVTAGSHFRRGPAEAHLSMDYYGYYLDRGNGLFTRLIPADTLPPVAGVSRTEEEHGGMVILPPLQKPQQPRPAMNVAYQSAAPKEQQHPAPLPNNLQNQIDYIVATSPKPTKKEKIYCDKWIHEGVCAFTQQGCKYKHEMPQDEATQWSLGLFHGFPAWWKKRVEEQQNSLRQGGMETMGSSPMLLPPCTPISSHLAAAAAPPPPPPSTQCHGGSPDAARRHGRSQGSAAFERQRLPPTREDGPMDRQMGYGAAHGWRPSGSQFMQNGIVPFFGSRGASPRKNCF